MFMFLKYLTDLAPSSYFMFYFLFIFNDIVL